jgi:membrane associated rhomboid family serine protease
VTLVFVLFLALALVAYKATTVDERAKALRAVQARIGGWESAAAEWYSAHAPYFDELRARKRFAPATQALAIVNILMFVIVFAARLSGGEDAVVAWGASVGTRTTNGEWWRLVTSLFVHPGPLHMLACLAGLVPLGLVLERYAGSVALAAVYVTSGVFAGLMTVSTSPIGVTAGASGAICGLYGLAVATPMWGLLRQERLAVPLGVVKWLAWAALIFAGYNVLSGIVPLRAEVTGFTIGALCGIAIGRGVARHPVPARRGAMMTAAALAIAVIAAVPLRGITDVRPDIDRMRETDERTAAAFRTAARQFVVGRKGEKALADLIERDIIPALEGEQPLSASDRTVPDDQKRLMADAATFLDLRIESWRLRARAFRNKGSLSMLRKADAQEGEARDVLARIPDSLSAR